MERLAVDETDVAILRRIIDDPLARSPEIAGSVDLAPGSVRRRLRALLDEGPVQGFRALPRPGLLGRVGRVAVVDLPTGGAGVDAATDLDPVVWASVDASGTLTAVSYRGPGGAGAGLADTLGGDRRFQARFTSEPGDADPLGPLDWRVLRAMIPDPRATVADLAELADVTPRTARSRRENLVDRGQVRVMPVLEAARSAGLVLHVLVVRGRDGEALRRADEVLDDAFPVARIREPEAGPGRTYLGHAETMAEAAGRRDEAAAIEGVRAAHLSVNVRREFAVERLQGWVDEKIEAWDAARSG